MTPREIVLVDTSIWIDVLDKKADAKIKNEMETLILEDRVATTPLIKMELLGGVAHEKEFKNLKEDLDALIQLDLTPEIWDFACRLSFRLRRGGLTAPNTDILLSAVALHHHCQLWHQDKHFDWIAKQAPMKCYHLLV